MIIKKEGEEIYNNVKVANKVFDRMLGLMFSDFDSSFGGLIIEPCNSIHTFFMKFNLDIIFLSKENKVLKIIENIPPWRMTLPVFGAVKVLELNAGKSNKVSVGDQLEVICTS